MRTIEVGGTPLTPGKTKTIYVGTIAAETLTATFPIDSDTVLLSLYVDTLDAGTLDVTVYTYTDVGKELEIISFPQLTAPTSALLVEKAAVAMANIRVEVVSSDGASVDIRAKGLTLGESSTRILGAVDATASQVTIGTSASVLLASSITDRSGIVVKNYSGAGTLFIGFDLTEATTGNGYPLGPGESMAIDIASGVTVYGIGTTTIDCRIMEAGG